MMNDSSPTARNRRLLLLLPIISAILLGIRYGERWLRSILLFLSAAEWAQSGIRAIPLARRVAGRFIAGETFVDALETARDCNNQGISAALNYLGEHVSDARSARAATTEIEKLITEIGRHNLQAYVSVKPSQLGLQIDDQLLGSNLERLLKAANSANRSVRIDMEESNTVDRTLAIFHQLRQNNAFADHLGIVIQAYLYRSRADILELIASGANIRLCKGAYKEPVDVAYERKADTDQNFRTLAFMLLGQESRDRGVYTAFATHDEAIINDVLDFSRTHNIPPSAFEFQMLYGIRRDLQEKLVRDGYQVRAYIPYGTAWYPYFMRRLAERPANLWFFISNLLR